MPNEVPPSDPSDESIQARIEAAFVKSTLPSELGVELQGNLSEESVHSVGESVLFFLKQFGADLQLQGLESVCAAEDYRTALDRVDRGFKTDSPLKPTDEFGAGAAMTVPVLRDGVLKSSIVMNLGIALALAQPDHELYPLSIHLLAHECAHVHDNEMTFRMLPDALKPAADFKAQGMSHLASSCWSEYIASYLSAEWGTDTYCMDMEPDLCEMLSTARDRGRACIFGHRMTNNIVETEAEMRNIYGSILIRSSYLMGHIDCLGSKLEDSAPAFYKLMTETAWFRPIFESYLANVRDMKATYDNWTSLQVYTPLLETCEAMMNAGGVFYNKLEDGGYYIGLNYPKD